MLDTTLPYVGFFVQLLCLPPKNPALLDAFI